MLIELIGCTGAGKSTLLTGILKACQEKKIEVVTGEEFVLRHARLTWIKSYIVKTLIIDVLSILACLQYYNKNVQFYRLIIKNLKCLPKTVGLYEKLNIIRNTLKKIGIFEIIHSKNKNEQLVLLDEGTLHTAHYLFVHSTIEPIREELHTFLQLVPVPDVVVSVQQDESILIKRTQIQGHKRIHDNTSDIIKRFIKHAIYTFNQIEEYPLIRKRLLLVDKHYKVKPALPYLENPSTAHSLEITRAGLEVLVGEKTGKNNV